MEEVYENKKNIEEVHGRSVRKWKCMREETKEVIYVNEVRKGRRYTPHPSLPLSIENPDPKTLTDGRQMGDSRPQVQVQVQEAVNRLLLNKSEIANVFNTQP